MRARNSQSLPSSPLFCFNQAFSVSLHGHTPIGAQCPLWNWSHETVLLQVRAGLESRVHCWTPNGSPALVGPADNSGLGGTLTEVCCSYSQIPLLHDKDSAFWLSTHSPSGNASTSVFSGTWHITLTIFLCTQSIRGYHWKSL